MRRILALYGAGGHGFLVAEAAGLGRWSDFEFFDLKWPSLTSVSGVALSGDFFTLQARRMEFDGVFVSIGDNNQRLASINTLLKVFSPVPSIYHPTASVSPTAAVGVGSFIAAGAIVGTNVKLGLGALINTGAIVDHDCVLGDGVHIAPGATLAGGVLIGSRTLIGVGATILPGVSIGSDCLIGAGSVVISDVGPDETIVGNPGRKINGAFK